MQIVDCVGDEGDCVKNKICAARDLWCGLNRKIIAYLESVNLKELADKQVELNSKGEKADMYFI